MPVRRPPALRLHQLPAILASLDESSARGVCMRVLLGVLLLGSLAPSRLARGEFSVATACQCDVAQWSCDYQCALPTQKNVEAFLFILAVPSTVIIGSTITTRRYQAIEAKWESSHQGLGHATPSQASVGLHASVFKLHADALLQDIVL